MAWLQERKRRIIPLFFLFLSLLSSNRHHNDADHLQTSFTFHIN